MKHCLILTLCILSSVCNAMNPARKQIQVSDNHHFLQYSDGKPFFYLGDTAWELFHRLDIEEAYHYLQDRADKGFTVIQAVALAELDGIGTANANGHLPFIEKDPSRPAVLEGPDNDYWDHVDKIVNRANELGLFIGMLPTWGRYWQDKKDVVFNPDNAYQYGLWLGKRYKDANIIWILGGDRNPSDDNQKAILRAMARGLQEGDERTHLSSMHPRGGAGSADFFRGEEWLDFNMRQNGHNIIYENYVKTYEQYQYEPAVPIIDGEPVYEDHPVAFDPDHRGHTVAADVRRALYWDLFNGACGHTYGHHSVWQMFDPAKRKPVNRPLMSWREALQQPGAGQMQHAKNLILSRPYFTRVPATDEVLVASQYKSEMPGLGVYHFAATRDTDNTYIMVYAPTGRTFTVRTSLLTAQKLKLWWFDPRTGKAKSAGIVQNTGNLTIASPAKGELQDWILVIDNADARYQAPGKH